MASANMHNLTTLIKRLEAATSRLEDMAVSIDPSAATNGVSSAARGIVSPGASDEPSSNAIPPPPAVEPLPKDIKCFDALIDGDVQNFVSISKELGGLIAEQSTSVLSAFVAQRKCLLIAAKARKPDIKSPIYMEILKELQSMIGAVNDIRVANRGSSVFNHLTMVSEGVAVLAWITIEPKPVDFVTDMLGAAEFYGNRVILEYKDKDVSHVKWVQTFYQIFKSLSAYVKQHHPTGVTWNAHGIGAEEAFREVESGKSSAAAAPFASSGSAPPPPPPLPKFDSLPAPAKPSGSGATNSSPSDMGAVFDQLSQGEAVTSGLRKVDPSQQTHKNPSLRASSAIPPARSDSQSSASGRGKSPLPRKSPKPESMRTKKPPRQELDGNKWIVENFDGSNDGVLEIDAQISQSILISRCAKMTIRVLNKANAISIDSSSHISLIVDSLISSVDVIKTGRFEMQVLGRLPTIMLDQVDEAAIYLSKESLGTEIFTSKCTAVNVNLPGATEEDDYAESAVPEQMKTVVRDGGVVSEIVEHAG